MTGFDIVSYIRDYCDINGILFMYGDRFHHNISAGRFDIADDELIMGLLPVSVNLNDIVASRYQTAVFNCIFMLGRKSETTGTRSSIDETWLQKHDNRLADMLQLMYEHINAFACSNELIISSMSMENQIDRFNTNIDFVVCNVSFTN